MAVIFIFFVKLLSPIGGGVALLVGCINKSRWMIAVGAIAGASVTELIVSAGDPIHRFFPLAFLIGVAAMAIWAAVGNIFLRGKYTNSRVK